MARIFLEDVAQEGVWCVCAVAFFSNLKKRSQECADASGFMRPILEGGVKLAAGDFGVIDSRDAVDSVEQAAEDDLRVHLEHFVIGEHL